MVKNYDRNINDLWICNKPIAHRGLHNETIFENSLPAFENAIKHNFAIELDVRKTLDNILVVCHDDNLKRITGKDISIKNSNFEDIKNLTFINSNEKIPTFEDVINLIDGKTEILIEIKNESVFDRTIDILIYEKLKNYKGDYAIESFNPNTVKWYKKNAPSVLRGQLSSFFNDSNKKDFFKEHFLKPMKFNKSNKPDFIAYNVEDLPNEYIHNKTNKNIPLIAWTVTSQEQFNSIKDIASNIIFENFYPNSD